MRNIMIPSLRPNHFSFPSSIDVVRDRHPGTPLARLSFTCDRLFDRLFRLESFFHNLFEVFPYVLP